MNSGDILAAIFVVVVGLLVVAWAATTRVSASGKEDGDE